MNKMKEMMSMYENVKSLVNRYKESSTRDKYVIAVNSATNAIKAMTDMLDDLNKEELIIAGKIGENIDLMVRNVNKMETVRCAKEVS